MATIPDYTLGIIGVRDYKGSLYTNVSYVVRAIEGYLRKEGLQLSDISVVTGGGRGVESMVVEWCHNKGVPCRKIPPNIQEFGPRKAFTVRNNHIVSECTELLVFWDGCIDITAESIMSAAQQSKKATVFPVL